MRSFESNEQYLAAVVDLAVRLDSQGHLSAANAIRSGMASVNGLTDGWALLLDALESVDHQLRGKLAASDRDDLRAIREAARRAVYRR